MQFSRASDIAVTMRGLTADPVAGAVTRSALNYLDELFGRRNGVGLRLAVRATQAAIPASRVEAISIAYIAALHS